MPKFDLFQPRSEPAASIYKAFQEEAKHRRCRTVEVWIQKEREAVLHACQTYAQQHGLRAPTMDEVISIEMSACGHVDYASKWALRLQEIMLRNAAPAR